MSDKLVYPEMISAELISQFMQFNSELPEVREINTSDLVSLGEIQTYFTNVKELFASDHQILSKIFSNLVNFTEAIILDSVNDSKNALSRLIDIVQLLKRVTENSDNAGIFGEFSEVGDIESFLNKSEQSHVELLSPPMGVLMINSSEDIIVYNEFASESYDHIDNVESDILSIENTGKVKDLIDNIFRAFHSIKGAAGFLGLTAINKLCHECENTLDSIRKCRIGFTPEISDALLHASDTLRKLFDILTDFAVEDNNGKKIPDYDISPVLAKIKFVTESALDDYDPDIDRDVIPGKIGGILVDKGILSESELKSFKNAESTTW